MNKNMYEFIGVIKYLVRANPAGVFLTQKQIHLLANVLELLTIYAEMIDILLVKKETISPSFVERWKNTIAEISENMPEET